MADTSSGQADHPPVQLERRITMVKELLATGLLENEDIVYSQKSGQRVRKLTRGYSMFYSDQLVIATIDLSLICAENIERQN